MNPGHYNQGTEQAHSRPEDRIEIPGELDVKGRTDTDRREFQGICPHRMRFNPNPPMDTDGRREDSGRGVREYRGDDPGPNSGRREVPG